jgi:uncharacterized MAPEG superfamily protein
MTLELTLLAWTLVLAIVQILLPGMMRTSETGVDYNASARDAKSPAPIGKVTGRLLRAQHNLFETLPLFAAAILIAHVAGRNGDLTYWGAVLYLTSRVVYVPMYAAGIPVLRSIVWSVGFVGLILVLAAILAPG